MAKSSEDVFGLARLAEGTLYNSLSSEKIDPAIVSENLNQYCKLALDVIFRGFPTEFASDVEEKLWAAHSTVNNHFRRTIHKLQRKNKAVETRKILKRYLEFLKTSQRFYRAYILRLDHTYGGIAELRQVAKNWVSTETHSSAATPSPETKQLILRSCSRSLVQLGDLCRYREIEINNGQRNWGPAIGYYSLANEVLPESGVAHNQLAVVALADGNHLRAVYYLYRSLGTKNPHRLAQGNLELEFKKVITAWDKGEKILKRPKGNYHIRERSLIAWFVRLHSKCYRGQEFAEHAELVQEVLSQLNREVTDLSINGKLQMLVLVNIAAEHFATCRLRQDQHKEESLKAYLFYLEINIMFFRSLLSLLSDELDNSASNQTERKATTELEVAAFLTPVTKVLLPALRLYSTWFKKNWVYLTARMAESTLSSQISELWCIYARVLSLLASLYPKKHVPDVDYMLEEEVDIIGFIPLFPDKMIEMSRNETAQRAKFSDKGVERLSPDIEMLSRIRELIVDGVQISNESDAPLVVKKLKFIYERKSNDPTLSVEDRTQPLSPARTLEHQPVATKVQECGQLPGKVVANVSHGEGEPIMVTTEAAMNRMVDDLVGSSDISDPLLGSKSTVPPTPPEQTFEDTVLVNGMSFGMSQSSTSISDDKATKVSQLKKADAQFGSYISPAGMPSPQITTLSTLPPILDQSGIWNSKAELNVPTSPFLDAAGAITQCSQSPVYFEGGSPIHSRNPSLTSIGSGQYAASGAWSPLLSIPTANAIGNYQSNPAANNVPVQFPNNLRSSGSQHSLMDLRESFNAYDYPYQGQMRFNNETFGFASSTSGSSPYASAYATPGALYERTPDRKSSSPFVSVAAPDGSDYSPWNTGSDSRPGLQKSLLGRYSVAHRQEG